MEDKMNTRNRITSALLAAGLLAPSLAQARWFEIEVLLFARNQDPALVAEQFPEQVEPLSERNRIPLTDFIYQPADPCSQLIEDASSQPLTQDLLATQVSSPCALEAEEDTTAVDGADSPAAEAAPESPASLLSTQPEDILASEQLADDAEPTLPEQQPSEVSQPAAPVIKFTPIAEFSPLSPVKPVLDEAPYLLTEEMLQFSAIVDQLEQHGIYRPLLHTGWRMDIDSKRRMPTLHLVAGQNYADRFDLLGNPLAQSPLTSSDMAVYQQLTEAEQRQTDDVLSLTEPVSDEAANSGSLSLIAQSSEQPQASETLADEVAEPQPAEVIEISPIWELEANLKLWLETWLHVDTQMQLRLAGEKQQALEPTDEASAVLVAESDSGSEVDSSISLIGADSNGLGTLVQHTETVPVLNSYLLDQFRRVRSEEIHYFDHPLMGMIIQIRKFEPTTLEQNETDS